MGYEDEVRARHAFEQAIRDFLSLLSAMTREEMELSIGRIADNLNSEASAVCETQSLLKGKVLRIYLDLRHERVLKQNKLRRLRMRPEMKSYFEHLGLFRHAQATANYEKKWTAVEQERKKLAGAHKEAISHWKEMVHGLPLLKRMFKKPPKPVLAGLPALPNAPPPTDIFVANSKKEANMSEYLVASVAEFELLPAPLKSNPVSPEQVRLLAN